MLRLAGESEIDAIARLAEIALRKYREGGQGAATRHLISASVHLHALTVGPRQAALDIGDAVTAMHNAHLAEPGAV